MPDLKKKVKTVPESLKLLDVYENWLAKQPVRPVKGKPGYMSSVEAESSS